MDYLELIVLGILLALGLFAGGYTERRRVRSLDAREPRPTRSPVP